jgi:hypothetical protein
MKTGALINMTKSVKVKHACVILALCAALAAGGFLPGVGGFPQGGADAVYASSTPRAVTVTEQSSVTTSWITQARPDENVAYESDLTYVQAGVSKGGKTSAALLRFALPAGVSPGEVVRAHLFVRKKSGTAPSVRVGTAAAPWGDSEVTWNDMEKSLVYPKKAPKLNMTGGGLYVAEVTSIVKSWLSGKTDNYGFVLKGTKKGRTTKFWSVNAKKAAYRPQLLIIYKNKKLKNSYGKFGYTAQPESEGNCFAYAMRDTDEIYLKDILSPAQLAEFQTISNTKSESKALAYFKQRALDYIKAHRKKLAIKSYRVLKSYKDKINPKKEYLVALKIGFVEKGQGSGQDGSYVIDSNDFDYHWRVRLKDGRWAEKITATKTRIIPGSNPKFNAAKFPWDANYTWGMTQFNDFYDSKPVYIAITKTAKGFTAHKH